ncbi:hypothetical protein GS534_24345 [Rhodococcus hoagii]|nr:hypothetical protein [Prescottella equi]
MLEELAQPYTPDEVGAYVAEAAEHVGWHRDPDKAIATFNRPDCECLEDHDSLLHIVKGAVYIAATAPFTVGQIRDLVDNATAKVGWVKA